MTGSGLQACSGFITPGRPSAPHPESGRGRIRSVHEEVSMRLLAGLAAGALVLSACGSAATLSTPSPTVKSTPTPTPTPQNKYVFLADLKSSNEVPAITNAEATCSGKGTFTLNLTKDASGTITAANAV